MALPHFSRAFILASILALLTTGAVRAAENREEVTRNDRVIAEAAGPWIYNDLARGQALAQESGKPLLVVFRCPP